MAIGSCTGCKPGTLEAFNAYLKQVSGDATGRNRDATGKTADDTQSVTPPPDGINRPVEGAVVGGHINLRA